ncbi:NFACT family protein [Alicyclobacillus cycloheptanicus]|uniref:Rqc2 homolog RqcH n=1 Tax=Alicyclobacillus cycloheptanicus TaxID=1457 RepID=A0ABT9XKJ7_9BACL|nr:NFACT RNA binding domain-containing protein [Alicyclobacillus cycloheptanicus]MDQ0190823.1 putative ribosome quality control (RQC) complex YloA/Tae2 family protein [Alicyclobacillus cycloheptanicus]WDM01476.1 NFACT family protein [Alicyclobacillus cycloheptanicus]
MDGLAVRALCNAWNERLAQARIEKIHQPTERELVLTVRGMGGSERLLLSAHRQFARAHAMFGPRPANPEEPPMFCMLLRRRIESGRIVSVRQQGYDRVVEMTIESVNDLGDHVHYLLLLEIMGKHSNILLCTEDETGRPGTVIDSIVRVTPQMSRVRPVLPGAAYQPAPPQQKRTAAEVTAADIAKLRLHEQPPDAQAKLLIRHIAGIGPISAQEVLRRAGDPADAQRVVDALQDLFQGVEEGREAASIGLDDLGRKAAAAPFQLSIFPRTAQAASFEEALDQVYRDTVQVQRQSAVAAELLHAIDQHLDRLRGKQTKLQAMIQENQDDATPRICGELLTAYAYQIEKGRTKVTLPNFYDDEKPITIALDPALSPIENAQAYYKLSSKRKRSIPILSAELDATLRDLAYLEGVRTQLEDATPETLPEIRAELVHEGFLNARRKAARAPKKTPPSRPQAYRSQDGFVIRVGRNNVQNDQLTFRRSRPDDLWLHVKNGPGSHVVISSEGRPIPASTLEEAAMLAAYFSKSRDSANVAVDYTEVKHVWKPAGARPGFALYDHHHTLFVTPDRVRLAPLLERKVEG